jgi:ubiquinone/menaquinone biosynthesis C-methylase UbiE
MTSTRNPWLDVPAAEYQAHMLSPDVAQWDALAELMAAALRSIRPARLLYLGCGIGNGLQHVDAAITRQVTGIDINSQYLGELVQRFPAPQYDRMLLEADLEQVPLPSGPFDLVHAPFLFEFLDWRPLLPRIRDVLAPDGALTVVLQRMSRTISARTPTPYFSLRRLDARFAFVDPLTLGNAAAECGLTLSAQRDFTLPRQKSFSLITFRHA